MRKNLIIWFLFHCFSTENKKRKGGQKASGKTRNATAGKGDRQVFTDLNCLLSGRVTSNRELMAGVYTIPNEIVY